MNEVNSSFLSLLWVKIIVFFLFFFFIKFRGCIGISGRGVWAWLTRGDLGTLQENGLFWGGGGEEGERIKKQKLPVIKIIMGM